LKHGAYWFVLRCPPCGLDFLWSEQGVAQPSCQPVQSMSPLEERYDGAFPKTHLSKQFIEPLVFTIQAEPSVQDANGTLAIACREENRS
jgi:hypothetical protein